jgi:Leucine-rich repeat (LRR) protein
MEIFLKRLSAIVVGVMLVCGIFVSALASADAAVHFNDPVLEARVCEQLGCKPGELTLGMALDVTDLNLSSDEGETETIRDLSGIEVFENLHSLAVISNEVADILPIASLKKLEYLDLGGNKISDLSPLRDLHLVSAGLWGNEISDLSPLSQMTDMEILSLDDNRISNLFPLKGMTKLNNFTFSNNEITDISVLANFWNLQYVALGSNPIDDLSPLTGLDLIEFRMWDCQVSDISALAGATNMEYLDLTNNRIGDISALQGMTKLKFLHLGGNPIKDYSPIADLYDGIGDKDFELDARTVMLLRGENPDEVIIFDDPVLLEWIRKALGVSGDITAGMAAGVRELNLEMDGSDWSYPRISNLNGLQYFINAEWINLGWALQSGEQQVDLSPLSGLTKLSTLQMHCDGLRDISALASLTTLRNLWIWGNDISDISVLAGATQMEELWLFSNHVSDISVMADMPDLWRVLMANNSVSDLSPLAGHTKLEGLEIAGNPVWDYQAIAAIYPQLTQKDFDINDAPAYNRPENPDAVITFPDPVLERKVRENLNKPEGDITQKDAAMVTRLEFGTQWREDLTGDMMIQSLEGLQYFINLKELSLYLNWVGDLTPIAGLTGLEKLNVDNNGLSDLSPIAGLTNLKSLTFENNNVEDISALSGMTGLETLNLKNNPIADYSPIREFYDSIQNRDFEYGQVYERMYKPENPDDVAVFPDKTLEKRIRGTIGKLEGDIYVSDIAFLEDLYLGNEWQESYAEGERVTDLTGLEYCLNLKRLDLKHSDLRDLGPIGGLPKLESLNLLDCKLEDISPLANLKSLQWLDLAYNRITDISALGGLVKLTGLHLDSNSIVDHTPIQAIYENLTDKDFAYGDVMLVPENPDAVVVFADPLFERMVREQIGMPEGPVTAKDAAKFDRLDFNMQWQETIPEDTCIHDITGVEYFINLKVLSLNFHAVGDISMVPKLKRLEELDIGGNGISDLSALAGMTGIKRLVAFANGIWDIAPLAGLTKLQVLQLEHNQITDISPLAGMTMLESLRLTDNPITDFSPIRDIVPNLTDKDF